MSKYIFICGAPRSGTTLLTNLFDGHSQIGVFPNGETHILQYWYFHKIKGSLKRFFFRDFLNSEDILLLTDAWAMKEHAEYKQRTYGSKRAYSHITPDRKKFIECYLDYLTSNPFSLKTIYDAVLRASFKINNELTEKAFFLEKRPLDNEICAIHLSEEFPEAKFIHIIRDPRTRYLSAKMRRIRRFKGKGLWASNLNEKDFASGHSEISMVSIELAILNKSVLQKKYYILRYEDLVSKPSEELEKITGFLEINLEDSLFLQTAGGKSILPSSSITNNSPWHGITNRCDERLRLYYKFTNKIEQKILRLFTGYLGQVVGYNISPLSRLRRRDLISPLKYENPKDYFRSRRRMTRDLLGDSWIIRNKHYHAILDKFQNGIATQD